MDRQIVYSGAIPLDTDQLNQNKNVMIGLGMALQAILGTATLFDGLTCTPTGPASLQVLIAPGSVYSFQNVDGTAYGSVGSDTTHQIIKQGISLGTLTRSCPAPGTTGQSINYLIQSAYQDADTGATILPYYNSSNPAVAYNGPGNSGTSQNTVRQGQCLVTVKTGVAATTGTQVTPAPDAGYTGLWVVTVANGQTTITSGNIAKAAGAPFISEKLTDKVSIPTGDARWMPIGGGTGRTRLIANTTYHVATTGNDSTGDGSSGTPWATPQKAANWIYQNVDSAGFTVSVAVADGTYTGGVVVTGALPGGGFLQFTGNVTTPANCIISTTNANCFQVTFGAVIGMGGFKLQTTTSGDCLHANDNGSIIINGAMNFGACAGTHLQSVGAGGQILNNGGANYTISGSAQQHFSAGVNSEISVAGCTITVTGTPAFSVAFASASVLGSLYCPNLTFSGSATGNYYAASSNGVVFTNGGGATYFPGSVAGTTATGGVYI